MISSPCAKLIEPHDPEDQRDAEREERVEAAERDRVDRVLDHELDRHLGERRHRGLEAEVGGVEPPGRARARLACPRATIRPVRRTYVRSASSTVRATFCSTSRIVTPSAPDLGEHLEHAVDDQRREPERRLVEQQQPRLGEQRAGDRELLLLAAGQRPRRAGERLREDREAARARARATASARARSGFAVLPSSRFSPTVSVAKMCRPSGTSAMPAPHDRLGRDAASDSPYTRRRPPRRGTRPKIAASVVDLPAPFGPTRPTISPSPTSRPSSCTAGMRPYRTVRSRTLEHARLPVPRYAVSTAGSRRISAGVPIAIVLPWSSTWIRSQSRMIRRMSCSITSSPSPNSSRIRRERADELVRLLLVEPRRRLVEQQERGRARARGRSPSRRSSPCGSPPAASPARCSSRSRASSSGRNRRPAAASAADDGGDLDVLEDCEAGEEPDALERAARARRARSPRPARR